MQLRDRAYTAVSAARDLRLGTASRELRDLDGVEHYRQHLQLGSAKPAGPPRQWSGAPAD
jgi:hypothetical protein